MMTVDKNILSILENTIPYPTFVVDTDCRIIDFNQKGKKFVPEAAFNSSLLELLNGELSQVTERLFLESKNFDRGTRDNVFTKNGGGKVNFEVAVSPFIDESQKTFIITFRKIVGTNKNEELQKFTVITDEIEKKIKDEEILKIIRSVKSAFPFTFIGKSKIQKSIDSLEGFFWIKDEERRYLLVNKKLAATLGVKPKQLEGRFEKDVLPHYQNTLFSNLDNYIIETTNSVAINGFVSYSPYGDEDYEIIEFPIVDLDNNVVAIIGVSQKTVNHKKEADIPLIILNELKSPFVYCNSDFRIQFISSTALELLNLSKDNIGDNIKDVVLNDELEKYTEDFAKGLDHAKNYSIDLDGKKIVCEFSRIEKPGTGESGILVTFNYQENEIDSKTAGKINMYDVIMKSMPLPMFIYDVENLRFLEVNDAALKLYGYSRDEFLEMDLTDLYAPEDIQTLIESSNKKAKSNLFTGPWRQKTRRGDSVVVELSKSELDYMGKQAHLNIVRDITDKVKSDKKLQLFKTAFDNSNDLIFITDKDGFITYANESVINSLKFSKQDLDKKPFLSLLKDSERADFNKEVLHSESRKEKKLQVKLKKKDGDFVDTKLIANPIADFNGELDSLNIVGKIEKKYEGEPETKIEYIEVEKESAGGGIDPGFLSNVFHELLTPINVIIGFVQELSESIGTPNEDQKEAIEIIKENQKILLQTMDTAAEYSALEDNKVSLKPEELVFVDLIDEIRNTTERTAKSNNLELTYGKISSSLALKTDRHHFMILITQFVKYAMQITNQKKIYLSASPSDNNRCIISIRDERDNISEQLLEGLKNLFTKDEDEIRKTYGFSRITIKLFRKLIDALDVKKEVIERDGDPFEYGLSFPKELEVRISSEVEPGHAEPVSETGADEIKEEQAKVEIEEKDKPAKEEREVNINVNLRTPEEERNTEQKKEEHAPPPQPARKQVDIVDEEQQDKKAVELSNYKCLYVEDQVDSQILFKVQMKELQEIDFAASFEEALPKIKSKEYDFIVMDINLEGEYNGLDALRVIQKLPGYQNVPVIAVTAYVLPGDRDKFIAAGFRDFISKPILKDKLVDSLQRIF